MKVFGVEGTKVPGLEFFQTDLWFLQVAERGELLFQIADVPGTQTKAISAFDAASIEAQVRAMLDEHSVRLSAVYQSLPDEPEPDVPDSITVLGVECLRNRLAGHNVVEYTGRSDKLNIIATALEHTVSPKHHMDVTADWALANCTVEVSSESPLEEVDENLMKSLRDALTTLAGEIR